MKFSLLTAAAIVQLASAHYFFDKLIIDGKETASVEFVRENTRDKKYNPTKWVNIRDGLTPDMDDMRCNLGSFQSASRTGTAEVQAGSKLAMKLAVGATFQHPGPGLVYMSKAPSTAKTYEGDGDWFKIYEEGICDTTKDLGSTAWCTWDKNVIEFTIPADIPNGEYLIRTEHIGVHGAHVGQAEFYYACAQVKVTGGGSGTPGPTVKFPGAYKSTDPSFNFSVYGGYKPYPMPGPAVWVGGSGSSSNTTDGATETTPTPTATATPTATLTEETTAEETTAAAAPAEGGSCSGNLAARHPRDFRA